MVQHHGAADRVLQFADIARPGVADQALGGIGGEAGKGRPSSGRVAGEEGPREQQQRRRRAAQRRHVDRQDMQPVEQVLAEAAGGDLGEGIAIGGADDADIDAANAGIADRLHGAALDEAQELGLQAEIHLADLVEEQRAAIGKLGRAGPGLGGAGEGAAHTGRRSRFP